MCFQKIDKRILLLQRVDAICTTGLMLLEGIFLVPVSLPVDLSPTCVALLLDLCEGPMAMLTLEEDCVSVVFPPSAAESPEITRPLEKLRFPNSKLRVDEDEETLGETVAHGNR